MLGTSSNMFDTAIIRLISCVNPRKILELGCGTGKFASLLNRAGINCELSAIQKLFSISDQDILISKGYASVVDEDILEYFQKGFDNEYDLIVALDVIEHFLHSDAISIIRFALYRCKFLLIAWPSRHPQNAVASHFDRHRTSFELSDLARDFDIVFYNQTGFAASHQLHRYHIALIRGYMNYQTFNSGPLFPEGTA